MNPMFYFLLSLTAVLAATANAAGPIYDTNGDIIFGRTSYYVLPLIWAAGGGLTLVPGRGNQCPLFIGQEGFEVKMGFPVRFSNWSLNVSNVPESENLNIEMDVKPTICGDSTYWWVTPAVSPFRSLFITAGPKPKTRDENSWRSNFKIVRKSPGGTANAYKIVFCGKGNDCINVGTETDQSGFRRLVLGSTTPLEVVFVKARETDTLSKTMSII